MNEHFNGIKTNWYTKVYNAVIVMYRIAFASLCNNHRWLPRF